MFNNIFDGKKVIVTGHTGFKGSWLSAWLKILGAEVFGISIDLPTQPNHFEAIRLSEKVTDKRLDICNHSALKYEFERFQPDFVFHLAAQPIVRQSYSDPYETYNTNVMGTLAVLEALRKIPNACTAVLITSDKCYDNVEWVWGYKETDALGGPDPYSASKGAAEIIIRAHIKSFFSKEDCCVRIATARAGNVIGGGDWASDRIVPDCVNCWSKGEVVNLRNPYSTRPWQHVLEPLSGYLTLSKLLSERAELHGESFNFGPSDSQNQSVLELVREMAKFWGDVRWDIHSEAQSTLYESGLLKLNCDKALHLLNWRAVLGFSDTVRLTSEWYKNFYCKNGDIKTDTQICQYMEKAHALGLDWAI